MTNVNAESANNTGLPGPNNQMTRDQMQTEASIIEKLLGAALALHNGDTPHDAIPMIEMAQDRSRVLNAALDEVNASEVLA